MSDTHPHRLRLIWYGATVFLSSAILLVLEITAGRLLAPYVGVTIYSWTSIIGVILAGLSAGNWLGGRWADKGAGDTVTGVVLVLGGIFSLGSLLVLTLVAPVLQATHLDLVSSSFLYVLTMFFIPAVLLGIPTPLLTTQALQYDNRSGHIIGRMHALAAMGSIVGTFLTGFVLIQYLGSQMVVVSAALLLFLLAIPFFRKASPMTIVSMLVFISLTAGITHQRNGFANPCDRESSYFCLRVIESNHKVPFGQANGLILDHLLHGVNHLSEPRMLVSPYVHLMDELVLNHFGEQRTGLKYFFAGGGSYTQPRAAVALDNTAEITVAELDPMVTETVSEQLAVDIDSMRILHGDARVLLNQLIGEKFDVIVTDAFHDIAIPYHLVTQEYLELVAERLTEEGLFTTNIVDAWPDPIMVKSMVKTLRTVFPHVHVWLEQVPDQPRRMTFVISASSKPITETRLDALKGFERSWYRVDEIIASTGTDSASLPVFTDDYVPVERMIASLLLTEEGR
jgi:predicted membrane-bound spermidine synthase